MTENASRSPERIQMLAEGCHVYVYAFKPNGQWFKVKRRTQATREDALDYVRLHHNDTLTMQLDEDEYEDLEY